MFILNHSGDNTKNYRCAYISKMEEEVDRTLRTVSSCDSVLTQSISPSNTLTW